MTWTEREYRLRTSRRRRRGTAALALSLILHTMAGLWILLREKPSPPTLHVIPAEAPRVIFLPRAEPPPPVPEPQPLLAEVEPIPQSFEPAGPQEPPPEEKKKPEKPPDPFADLPALWWQRETVVTVMDRFRRGIVAPDSSRVPLVQLQPGTRELATALLNDQFDELRPWIRAAAAKRALRERFPYLDE